MAETDKATILTAVQMVAAKVKEQGYQTADDVAAAINGKLGATYIPKGSCAFADLPSLTAANLGFVYNMTDSFTTTADFLEGAGVSYPQGSNVVVVKQGDDYKYDVLSGAVDLSNYVQKETGKGLSTNDFTNDYLAKLNGVTADATKVETSDVEGNIKINGTETTVVSLPTEGEVTAMLDSVFGAAVSG